jgi:hypothetical protein
LSKNAQLIETLFSQESVAVIKRVEHDISAFTYPLGMAALQLKIKTIVDKHVNTFDRAVHAVINTQEYKVV